MKNLNTEYLAISPRYRYQTAKIGPRLMLVRSDADWADLSGWCRCRRRGEITLSLFSKKGQGLLCLALFSQKNWKLSLDTWKALKIFKKQ